MTAEQIAHICHEANRAYCATLGDDSQQEWDAAPAWQRSSAINGVQFLIDNPCAGPADSHENWVYEKRRAGWAYGPKKDPDMMTHPCIMAFHELPHEQQQKDRMFVAIVDALTKARSVS